MTTPTAPLLLVAPHPGTIPARAALQLNQPNGGVLAICAQPPTGRLSALAHPLLSAAGAPAESPGGHTRRRHEHVAALTALLACRPITLLCIDHAERVGAAPLNELLAITATTRTTIALIHRPPVPDRAAAVAATWPHRRCRWADLATLARSPSAAQPAPPPPFPDIPPSAFPYHALDWADLPAAVNDVVWSSYHRHLDRISARLGRDATAETALAATRDALTDATSPSHAVVIAAAAAAAAFHAEVLLTVDCTVLCAAVTNEPAYQGRTRHGTHLDAYRRPALPAVAALSAAGVDIDDMPALTLAAVPALAATMPTDLARHLHAARTARLAGGATPSDPLLVTREGRSVNRCWIRNRLSELAATHDQTADRRTRRPGRDTLGLWARRHGITARRYR